MGQYCGKRRDGKGVRREMEEGEGGQRRDRKADEEKEVGRIRRGRIRRGRIG